MQAETFSRVQAALTRVRERHAYQMLGVELRALPHGDLRKLAWLNVDRYSAAWVTSWAAQDLWLQAASAEVSCRYLGLVSPACVP